MSESKVKPKGPIELPIDYKITAKVGKFKCEIPVGFGFKDITWFALCAAQQYSKAVYPRGHYLPCLVVVSGQGKGDDQDLNPVEYPFDENLHPAMRIVDMVDKICKENNCEPEDLVWRVKIKKNGQLQNLQEEEQIWYERAFGKRRNQMKVKFTWMENPKYQKGKVQKNAPYKVRYKYRLFQELEHVYRKYKKGQFNELTQVLTKQPTQKGQQLVTYKAEFWLPFGDIDATSLQWFYVQNKDTEKKLNIDKPKGAEGFLQLTPTGLKSKNITANIEKTKSRVVFNSVKESKKVEDDVEEQKPINVGECPFTPEQLKNLVNLSFIDEEENETAKIQDFVFSDNIIKDIYNIFYHYSTFYKQSSGKDEQRAIIWQDMMFILKYYKVFEQKSHLQEFLENYEMSTQPLFEDVVWTINTRRGVQFPDFINILIRSAQFIKTEYDTQQEELDEKVKEIFNKIIIADKNEDNMTEFAKHMRFNSELIQLLRDLSENLLYIYAYKLKEQDKPYVMEKKQIIDLIQDNELTGDNFENLVELALTEILGDKDAYSGFGGGIYYYEFLQILQWLALIYVQSTQEEMEEMEDENVEITEEALLEKTQYFIENLINNYHTVLEALIDDDENGELMEEMDEMQDDQQSDN